MHGALVSFELLATTHPQLKIQCLQHLLSPGHRKVCVLVVLILSESVKEPVEGIDLKAVRLHTPLPHLVSIAAARVMAC